MQAVWVVTGPEARVKRPAGKFLRAGVPEDQVEKLWLCGKCKQEALAGEFKRLSPRASSQQQ